MLFYQGGTVDNGTHVPGPVAQSGAESQYNSACTSGMALARFRMLIHEFLNKDPDIVPQEDPIIILGIKYAVCMARNGKDTKHTRHISRRVNFVRNVKNEKCTRLNGVKEVFNWQTLQLRMLQRML